MPLIQGKQVAPGTIKAENVYTAEIPTLASGGTFAGDVTIDATLTVPSPTEGTEAVPLSYLEEAIAAAPSIPIKLNKDMTAIATEDDGDVACGDAVEVTPAADGYIRVAINGVDVEVGDGVTTKECFFSVDGVTPRLIQDVEEGDLLYWNGSVAGYQLTAVDKVDFMYNVNSDGPISENQEFGVQEGGSIEIDLGESTEDRAIQSYQLVRLPRHGIVGGTAPKIRYTPKVGYTGPDVILFRAKSQKGYGNIAAINISVFPLIDNGTPPSNNAPVANAQSVSTSYGTRLDITLTGTDADSDPLLFIPTVLPINGALTGTSNGKVSYWPGSGNPASDSFKFKAFDGKLYSNEATITITINPGAGNDSPLDPATPTGHGDPIAGAAEYMHAKNTIFQINLVGHDPEGLPLTYTIVDPPEIGNLTGTVPSVFYNPITDFTGPDFFTFKVNNGTTDSNIAMIKIIMVENEPIANDQSVSPLEDQDKNIVLTSTLPPGHSLLQYSIVEHPTRGIIKNFQGLQGTLTYRNTFQLFSPPNDAFKFDVSSIGPNGPKSSNIATVVVSVDHVNHPPVVQNMNEEVLEGVATQIILVANDTDIADVITFEIVQLPKKGNLVNVNANTWSYTPDAGTLADTFTYKANDTVVDSNIAVCNIVVNQIPTADPNTIPVDKNQAITLPISGSDPENLQLDFTVVNPPASGVLGPFVRINNSSGTMLYTPVNGFVGDVTFTFKVTDDVGQDSPPATIELQIRNSAPTVLDVSGEVVHNHAYTDPKNFVDIPLIGFDVNMDALTFIKVDDPPPNIGTATIIGTNYRFTPADAAGPQSFQLVYRANDGTVDGPVGLVDITITNVAPEMDSVADSFATVNKNRVFTVSGTDADGDHLTFVVDDYDAGIELISGPTSTGDLTATVTIKLTSVGAKSIRMRAFDGFAYSAQRTINFTGVTEPTIHFTSTSSSGNEGETKNVQVVMSGAHWENVTVQYAASGGTATPGVDYSTSPGSPLTITPGNTNINLEVTLTSDGSPESPETAIFTLSNPTNATLGANTQHTLTISDVVVGPPVASFSTSSQTVTEGNPISVYVTLSSPAVGNVTVNYSYGGSASGSDYNDAGGGAVLIADGQTSNNIYIETVGGDGAEGNESLVLTLESAMGATIHPTNNVHTVTLADDGGGSTASFASSSQSATEGDTITATVTLNVPADTGGCTVYYSIGGDVDGGDYNDNTGGSIFFDSGESSKDISIEILGTDGTESIEDLVITLTSGDDVTIHPTDNVHTVSISDDGNGGGGECINCDGSLCDQFMSGSVCFESDPEGEACNDTLGGTFQVECFDCPGGFATYTVVSANCISMCGEGNPGSCECQQAYGFTSCS